MTRADALARLRELHARWGLDPARAEKLERALLAGKQLEIRAYGITVCGARRLPILCSG